MEKPQDNQLLKIQNDIKEIQKLMNISASSFSLIYSSKNFRFFFLAAGIWSAFFSLFYYLLLLIYNSSNEIPMFMVITYFALLGLGWLMLIILRIRITTNMAKEIGIDYNFLSLFKESLSTRMWLVIIPVILVFIIIPFKYSSAWSSTDYIPYTGIVLGLVLNMIGVMIREKEYSFAGLWLILSGICGFLIFSMPVYAAFGLIFSPACFIFAGISALNLKEK